MSKRKTVSEKEKELLVKPVEYHPNGQVKFPATYSQLLRECERLYEENRQLHEFLSADVDRIALERYRRLDRAGGVSHD